MRNETQTQRTETMKTNTIYNVTAYGTDYLVEATSPTKAMVILLRHAGFCGTLRRIESYQNEDGVTETQGHITGHGTPEPIYALPASIITA